MTKQEFIESIRLEGEEWRDIDGYVGDYIVSSFGRIACLERPKRKGRGQRTLPAQLLSTRIKQNGYVHAILSKESKHKTYLLHRLVAKAFIPNPDNKPTIDHIDRDRANNRIDNLRWCTLSENMNNPLTKEACRPLIKSIDRTKRHHPVVSLKNGQLVKIYACINDAVKDGFVSCQISSVCSGRHKTHRGLHWMYLSDYENLVSMSKNS